MKRHGNGTMCSHSLSQLHHFRSSQCPHSYSHHLPLLPTCAYQQKETGTADAHERLRGCPSRAAKGASLINSRRRVGGGGGRDSWEGHGVCNCGGAPARAPYCLRKDGDMPVRLKMACISACIDTGLRFPRVRTSAPS